MFLKGERGGKRRVFLYNNIFEPLIVNFLFRLSTACVEGGRNDGKKLLHSLMLNEIGCICRSGIVLYPVCILCIYMFAPTSPPEPSRIPFSKRGCRFLTVRARKLKTIQQIIDFYLANGLFHFRHLHSKEIKPTILCTVLSVHFLHRFLTFTHTRSHNI